MPTPLDQDPRAARRAFGQRVRELREVRGLSQEELRNAADVHTTAVSRMERGEREPRLTTILRLARGLGVEPGDLVNGLDTP